MSRRGAKPQYDRQTVRAMFQKEKLSVLEIARRLDCHEQTARAILSELGLKYSEKVMTVNGPAIKTDRAEQRQWKELAPWPKGIRFEDAQTPNTGFLGKVGSGDQTVGNASSLVTP
jgi:sulfur carrier protein ThiS